MPNKNDLKALGLIGGIFSVIAAFTDYRRKKKWQEVHTAALLGGGVVAVVSFFA